MITANKLFMIILFFGILISKNSSAQQQDLMKITQIQEGSCGFPQQCSPDDMIICINTSIQNLRFESNMEPDSAYKVIPYPNNNQYIICHKKEKLRLAISGPNLRSEEIEIFDLNNSHVYSITSNTSKGTVNILTTPLNSNTRVKEIGDQVFDNNKAIILNTGKYHVSIEKPDFEKVDTIIDFPENDEKIYRFNLIPSFSRIDFDLGTEDNIPFNKPPTLWIDSQPEMKLEAIGKGNDGTNLNSFDNGVVDFKLYKGNIIPLPVGVHSIKIEAEGYNPIKKIIKLQKGERLTIRETLETTFGYLTIVDKENAEGAAIFIDNQSIGNIPKFKVKTKVGKHTIRLERPGFRTMEIDTIVVKFDPNNLLDKSNRIDVSMEIAKKIQFESEPTNAEILIDGTSIGFTPESSFVSDKKHVILVQKKGFATEKKNIFIEESTPNETTFVFKLYPIYPLTIRSEMDNLLIHLKGTGDLKNIEIDSTKITPAQLELPYGKYKLSLSNNKTVLYKSIFNHSPKIITRGKLPIYSRGSFHVLSGYYEDQNNFEASFGRILLFPGTGLSTSLINVDYKVIPITKDSINYNFKTLAPNIFFLNWDWRIGGSVLRQLDLNFLGRVKYTPGLKILSTNIPDFTDVEMQNYFYGFEVSTRLSYFNLCFKYGRQINKGNINFWDAETKKYTDEIFPISENRNVATIGITLNGKVYKSNNMLRLWQKPLINFSKRKSAIKK